MEERLDELVEQRRAWTTTLLELLGRVADRATVEVPADAAQLWGDVPTLDVATIDERAPDVTGQLDVVHHVDRVLGDVDTGLARALDVAATQVEDQRRTVDELAEERARVASEPNPGPPANPTRPDGERPDRPGAPLFVCVDFAEHVDDGARAGLEAALAGAGLLDARVGAGGADALDASLVPDAAGASVAPTGSTLADVLVPVPVDGVDADTITAALASVPLEDGIVELHTDGRWRLGPVAGRFAQDEARFIGHAARERRRERRLAELDERLVAERAELDRLDADRAALTDLRDELGRQRAEQPSTAAVAAADADVRTVQVRLDHAAELDATAAAELAAATAAAETATSDLHRRAVAAELPHDRALLGEVRSSLDQCDRAQERIAERTRASGQASSALAEARAAHDRAVERAQSDAAAASQSAETAELERRRHDELQRSVGESAQLAAQRLGDAESDRTRLRRESGDARRTVDAATRSIAGLDERIAQLEQRRLAAEADLTTATKHVVVVTSAEVAEVLDLDGVAPDAEPLDAARAVLSHTGEAADDATNRMERAHREILLDGLHAGHDPSMPKLDGVDVVRVGTAEGEVPIGALARQLRADHERTSQLLTDKERSIFETHLLSRVGDALRVLLFEADAFQHRINDEMADAPTESGMVVELQWEVDGDEPGLRDAVQLLRQSPEMLSTERREQLQQFFLSRIEQLRATEPGRSFAETLTTALDYRSWHRFVLFARFAAGKRQRVTRTFYKSLSGGEAASLLHLPLFASAAAQYSLGSIAGPRLVALDEAFVGIDDQMRGRLMGLLRQLDLDVILTSHEFWGFYDTVPSLVVYDLKRTPPVPGVYAQRFDWVGDGG